MGHMDLFLAISAKFKVLTQVFLRVKFQSSFCRWLLLPQVFWMGNAKEIALFSEILPKIGKTFSSLHLTLVDYTL